MLKAGLYSKFPDESSLISDFKRYLNYILGIANCQKEVRSLSTYIFSQNTTFQQCLHFFLMMLMLTFISHRLSKVDNVSRFLRYLQPSGDEPNLDFLKKSKETRDYLTRLRLTDMSTATILNYIQSMIRFVVFLTIKLDPGEEGAELHSMCQAYKELLLSLKKPVAKARLHEVVTIK